MSLNSNQTQSNAGISSMSSAATPGSIATIANPATWASIGIVPSNVTGSLYSQAGWNPIIEVPIKKTEPLYETDYLKLIASCKSREECQEKYGSCGLACFETLLNSILQDAIKSQETFTTQLQEANKTIEILKDQLRQYIITGIPPPKWPI